MPPDRDQTVERLLKRSLRTQADLAPDAPCLDAETLAAWVDGGLARDQISLAESHLARCARCRAIVAATVRSAPPVPVADPWWRRNWRLGWLMPLAAGAAAVVLWIAAPTENPSAPEPVGSIAERSEVAPGREASPSPAPPLDDRLLAPPAPENERQRLDAARELRLKSSSSDTLAGAADSARVMTPAAARAPVAAPAQAAEADAQSNRTGARPPVAVEIESPDPAIRWRLGIPGVVERSTNAGASWENLASGVTTDLTTGAAPSTSVCWIVGRQGTVLRTTDGRSWHRVPFPLVVDLTAVQATDASSATVTTADGRSFRTGDGGNSWNPALQEF